MRKKNNKMTEKGLNIREGRTYLDTHSSKGIVSFVAPAFGHSAYAKVGQEITEAGLVQPTMKQTASLIYDAWQNPAEKYSKDIIGKLRTNWLWGFNGLLYVPKEGVYIQDRPEVQNGRVVMNQEDLVKKMESNDESVRFVPFGFKRESQSSLELAKNPFVQALAGEEGADKLAQVSENYKIKPFVWALENINSPQIRVASLDSVRYFVGDRLDVYGNDWGGSNGYAFGVFE